MSGQNAQLRQLHEANLVSSQERVSAAVMQRVAIMSCQLFGARSAMLTVLGPHGETEAKYHYPEDSDSCVDSKVVRMVQQVGEPVCLSMNGSGPLTPFYSDDSSPAGDCLGIP